MRVRVLRSEPLDTLLVGKRRLDLRGNGKQLGNILLIVVGRNGTAYLAEFYGEQVRTDQLAAVSLGRRNRNLGTGKRVHTVIRLPRDRTADHVDDCHRLKSLLLCHTKCRKGIGGLAGLGYDDDKRTGRQLCLTVTEFRRKLHAYGKVRQFLHHVLRLHADMPCGAACRDIDLGKCADVVVRDADLGKVHTVRVSFLADILMKRVERNSRLLVDFLHHEMLKAALFGCLGIPLDRGRFLLNGIAVEVIKRYLAGGKFCHLQVSDVVHLTGVV